ncbi:crossover junction endonuclease MUS81 [Asbolus verrucosus]|uniref:Crossover junction endonuclease MUS81 n=1 Tax=Asbolus verrucosus TaxID=1661398 RepID=A0A482VZ02_ASBVE|nr:crossover junction endonuclease MUS81 [Asbolus verrucosus]
MYYVDRGKSNPENEPILQELKKLNLQYEVRNLKVGDYVWICRDVNTNIELVLPYIVERKRMDDLGCSIKDDRFHEQKFRLKQCGLQNLIYLVESHGKNEHVGLPINTLLQAATNTLVQDGFSVKFTDSVKDTCQYLACVTKVVTNVFRHFKAKEMFIRQLLQIKGMSLDKALAVVEKYPTPKHLRLAYKETDQAQGEKLLSCIKYGTLKKNVGQVLSQIVYQLFSPFD